jgi:hypothetical protein
MPTNTSPSNKSFVQLSAELEEAFQTIDRWYETQKTLEARMSFEGIQQPLPGADGKGLVDG